MSDSRWQTLQRNFREAYSGELVQQRRAYDGERLDSALVANRRNAYRYILLILAIVLAPVDAHNFYTGQIIPALAGLTLLLVFVINIGLLSTGKDAFLSPALVLLLTIAMVVLSMVYGQTYSLYWLYPLLVALPVLLRTRWAIWLGILCGVIVTPLVFYQFESETAIIICLSMAHTWLVSAWLMYAVNLQSSRLKDMALTDALTGAFNRRYFESQAEQALEIWQRYQRPSSLLVLDIDHFKQINDSFGHTAGDEALKGLVALISQRIRGVDTLCRYGGEEFVVLLAEARAVQAASVAEEIRRKVEEADLVPGSTMTISIGVADLTQASSVHTWFQAADVALYRAKQAGRNRVEMENPEESQSVETAGAVPLWR
jgi:diguanylate cyclase (GGDEF)-like protein